QEHPSQSEPFSGFLAVVIACCLSGFAGIYFEKILKGSAPVSLWMRNIQMCVFAIPASFGGVMWQNTSTYPLSHLERVNDVDIELQD
ncbi:hypothetical protein OESDEN_22350, partial [Oesophagostomum dentatum]